MEKNNINTPLQARFYYKKIFVSIFYNANDRGLWPVAIQYAIEKKLSCESL